MGSLITETPYSEITATLEILDRFGVGRDDLRRFRAAAPEVQSHTAYIFKTADTCSSISTTSGNERPVSLVRIMQTALGELPADYQEVIMLRNLQRLSFNEVAQRMDRSRPAVQMLWMRAIRKLQEAMEEGEG